ncbi:BF3164 family lipoprotein [Roseivirga sp.]|uniref:BF3164 family lipoprotein n=1 Tax=Roseivirga sp. TaxID=1964215 RepID=UPI002B26D0BA|nr:BF3164 family lipoprotein [Roseivirga sp.]
MPKFINTRAAALLIFTFTICGYGYAQTRDIKIYKSFPKSENLKHSKVQINEVLYPRSIHLIDDLVVIMDEKSEYAVHFYKLSDWSLVARYGRRGDGPAEVRTLKFYGQSVVENNETYLWFSDFSTFKLKKISLSGMLKDVNTEPILSYKLPPELAMTYKDIYAISDTEFVGTVEGDVIAFSGDPEAGRFFHLNMRDKKIKWTANFPEQKLQEPKKKMGYLYSSKTTFNAATNQIASGMRYYDRIDIINVKKDNVLTVVQEDNIEVQEVDLRDDFRLIPLSTKSYYGFGYSSEKLIYFSYSNVTSQQDIDFFGGLTTNYPNIQLQVFDWKGNPVYHAQLDKPSLGTFFVDEKTRKMYVIDGYPENEDDMIVSYTLPNLIYEKNK